MTTTVARHYIDALTLAVTTNDPDDAPLLGVLLEAATDDDLTAEDLLVIVTDELIRYRDAEDPKWAAKLIRSQAKEAVQ